jgi:GntR family transcriptional regulator, transcriptional repressor for pyruvate dehydrogenase complex
MVWLKSAPLPQPRLRGVPRSPQSPAGTCGDVVVRQLRDLISGGAYPPGRRLPSERNLADRLGVGRPAVREAIRILNALGVLDTRRGSGTYVTTLRARGALFDPLSLVSSRFSLLHQLEVRKLLEARAAVLAARRATENQLREIQSVQETLQEPDLHPARRAELDLALHFAVVRAAGNPLLTLLHQALHPLLRDHAGAAAGHAALIDAIASHQPANAAKAVLRHLEESYPAESEARS